MAGRTFRPLPDSSWDVMNTELAHESAVDFGRWNLALGAMLAVMSAVAALALEPNLFVYMTVNYAWLSAPYLAIVLMVAFGSARASAWTGAALGAFVLLASLVMVAVTQGDALAAVAYMGAASALPLLICAVAHVVLVACAISLLRGGSAGSSPLAVVLSLSLLAVVAFVLFAIRH